MPPMPKWSPPEDITKVLEEGDGFWEDDRWSPILLTAMSDTEFNGREIPVAWQAEFQPSDDDCRSANARLEEMGIEPDGYGWGAYIQRSVAALNMPLAERLQTNDCESDTCVIWVEAESDCRDLIQVMWRLIFGN